jgi:hypothetical protein
MRNETISHLYPGNRPEQEAFAVRLSLRSGGEVYLEADYCLSGAVGDRALVEGCDGREGTTIERTLARGRIRERSQTLSCKVARWPGGRAL